MIYDRLLRSKISIECDSIAWLSVCCCFNEGWEYYVNVSTALLPSQFSYLAFILGGKIHAFYDLGFAGMDDILSAYLAYLAV